MDHKQDVLSSSHADPLGWLLANSPGPQTRAQAPPLGAGCEDRAIRVWRVKTSAGAPVSRAEVTEVAAWTGHVAPVSALRWFPRRMAVASAGPDGTTVVWMPNLDALRAPAAGLEQAPAGFANGGAPFQHYQQHLLAAGKI